jgi:hypothetical protein
MPTEEDWRRAHQQGRAELKKMHEAAGTPPHEADRIASHIQDEATNRARAQYNRR